MGCHPKALKRMAADLKKTTDPERRDEILDQWNDVTLLATNYDADKWGLDPDDPMWNEKV